MNNKKVICKFCKHIMYQKYFGFVCRNKKCDVYQKCESGWYYIPREEESPISKSRYLHEVYNKPNINTFSWNMLKIHCMNKFDNKCQQCNYNFLEFDSHKRSPCMHHILPRDKFPELTFDLSNVILVCDECHKKTHKKFNIFDDLRRGHI